MSHPRQHHGVAGGDHEEADRLRPRRDEGDELTTRRRERALEGVDEPARGWTPRPQLPAASVTFAGADEADAAEESPFAALRDLALAPEGRSDSSSDSPSDR